MVYKLNPTTGRLDLVDAGGGGGGITSLTPDTGGPISSSNIDVFGREAGTVSVMTTENDAGDFFIENRTWDTQYVVDNSTTEGLRGTFSTIQDAIDQAVADGMAFDNPKIIKIRVSEDPYIEDLEIRPGLNLISFGNSPQSTNDTIPILTIQGTHTIFDFCVSSFIGIHFLNPSASTDTFTNDVGTSANPNLYAENCIFELSGTGKHLQVESSYCKIFNCCFNQPTFQQGLSVSPAGGTLTLSNCSLNSCGIQAEGALNLFNCTNIGPVINGQIIAFNNSFISDGDNISGTPNAIPFLFNNNFESSSNTATAVSMAGGFSGNGNYINLMGNGPRYLSTDPISINSQSGNILGTVRTANDLLLQASNDYCGVTDTSAARTITLPQFASDGHRFIIKDESGVSSVNNITVVVAGGANIDGSASYVINQNYGSVTVIFNATDGNYYTIGT